MKSILIVLLCGFGFVAATATATATAVNSAKRYESGYDRLMDRLDPVAGKFPFPPQEIVKRLAGRENYEVHTSIIPHGMSPQARHTDYCNPRTIISWNGPSQRFEEFHEEEQPPVFIAYAPKLHELEILTYNIKTGESEFRKVFDYGPGLEQKVEARSRVSCQACHQSGNAIFAPNNWQQSASNKIVYEHLQDKCVEPFAKSLVKSYGVPVEYNMGEYVFPAAMDSPGIDVDTDLYSQAIMARAACSTICADNVECKREIVASALLYRRDDYYTYYTQEREDVFRAMTGKYHFKWSNFHISDNEPDAHGRFNLKGDLMGPLLPRFSTFESDVTPLDLYGQDGYMCFNFSVADRQALMNLSYSQIMQAVESPAMTALLNSDWVMNTERVMNIAQNPAEPPMARRAPAAPVPIPDVANVAALAPSDTPHLFAQYCGSCHQSGNGDAPELPLLNLKKLALYDGRFSDKVYDLLRLGAMPPADARQPSADEKTRMLKAVKR